MKHLKFVLLIFNNEIIKMETKSKILLFHMQNYKWLLKKNFSLNFKFLTESIFKIYPWICIDLKIYLFEKEKGINCEMYLIFLEI